MGKLIKEIALQQGHEIVSIIDRTDISIEALRDAEVVLDFSHPDVVVKNIHRLAQLGKSMVIGTTGWDEHLLEVKQTIETHQVGLIYGANFSLGVHMLSQILRYASGLLARFAMYDVALTEAHHQHKVDSPSGTALQLARVISEVHPDKEVPISSMRCGSIPGTHSVIFDSPADTITLTHQARSRTGFAEGALVAAAWIKDRRGFYTIEDLMA